MPRIAIVYAAAVILAAGPANASELVGFAVLPADTFAEGPPAGGNDGNGNPISGNGRVGPFPGQPVQGFSGVQRAPDGSGAYWFLSDNGFGSKANSADYLLRIYQARPAFKTAAGGTGAVAVEGFVQLSDPFDKIPWPIVNEGSAARLLTGSDFDVEAFVVDPSGDIWVGDEFGPFLLRFDSSGRLLEAPIATPQVDARGRLDFTREVRSPDHPVPSALFPTNLARSRGFEGLAFRPNGFTLYPLLEGAVTGDPANSLRIYEAKVNGSRYSDFVGFYRVEVPGHAIGDFNPINNQEFLVIERDNGQGAAARFKKVYKIDITKKDAAGFVEKVELVDLLNVADPADLNADGSATFTFPFQTIEDVMAIDATTILVANDNNYPFGRGRGTIDNNEIILIKLDEPLRLNRQVTSGR